MSGLFPNWFLLTYPTFLRMHKNKDQKSLTQSDLTNSGIVRGRRYSPESQCSDLSPELNHTVMFIK